MDAPDRVPGDGQAGLEAVCLPGPQDGVPGRLPGAAVDQEQDGEEVPHS